MAYQCHCFLFLHYEAIKICDFNTSHISRFVIDLNKHDSYQSLISQPYIPKFLFSEHHQSHAAAALYPSPFEEAVVLCMDGVGEWATTTVAIGKKNNLEIKNLISKLNH